VLNLMSQVNLLHPLKQDGKIAKSQKAASEVPFFAMDESGNKKVYEPKINITSSYNKSTNKLAVNWNYYLGAKSYKVKFGWSDKVAAGSAKETTVDQNMTLDRQLTISDLNGSGDYVIRIMPLDADGKELADWTEYSVALTAKPNSSSSSSSNTSTFKDDTDTEAYKQVGLTIESTDTKTVTCKWNAIDGATKYSVDYKKPGDKNGGVKNVYGTTEVTFKVSKADTDFVFSVRAFDKLGKLIVKSGWSKVVHVK